MTPLVIVSLRGSPVSGVEERALSGVLTEYDGEKADTLSIEISNYDGRLMKPRRGDTIAIQIGWRETGIVKVGNFVVTGVTKTGPVATFHVRADSADLKKSLKEQKNRNWKSPKNLKDVFQDIAGDNDLHLAMDQSAGKTQIEKAIAQTGESDMHLAMRLGRQYGLLVKFKDGYLTVVKRGGGTTAGGGAADHCLVTPNDCEGFTFVDNDRPARGAAKATHYDRSKAKRTVESSTGGLSQSGVPDYTLPFLYGTQTEAKAGSVARKAKFDRDTRNCHLTLKPGSVGVAPGGIMATEGFHDDDDQEWPVKQRHFAFSPEGIEVRMDCEMKEQGE